MPAVFPPHAQVTAVVRDLAQEVRSLRCKVADGSHDLAEERARRRVLELDRLAEGGDVGGRSEGPGGCPGQDKA